MDSAPLVMPASPIEPRRPPMPFMAALVPVAAGVVMWLVTGSLLSLCFAALGPLMLLASVIDSARTVRRSRRTAHDQRERAWELAEEELARRHAEERERRRLRHPDAVGCLVQPPLRGADAPDAGTELVVGAGQAASAVTATGGEGERERDFRRRCATISDVPITVKIGGGVALRGPRPMTAGVARALLVQLCLRYGAAHLTIAGDLVTEEGLALLPQARGGSRGTFRIAVASSGAARPVADAVIWLLETDSEVPDGVTTVMDVVDPSAARLRTPEGSRAVAAECLSREQVAAVGAQRAAEAEALDVVPATIALSDLAEHPPGRGLAAVIGRGDGADVVVDIVEDGPHAIVTGTTGTGKSELLVTWVAAMARTHGPRRLVFVLADFKGGTAFEALRELPQVVAVITDLDDGGARRGVSSLTAELRRREAFLAQRGARDIDEVDLPRLVIVVDEFAALLQEHPDLGGVFIDIAARGRALGMHLILGTQRATGVIRDALAANCPLRVSLRVTEPADSRMVIGTDAAAELPGGAASRGLALVRRPHDDEPVALRVGLTGAGDVRGAVLRWADDPRPLSPWLPALPTVLPLASLVQAAPEGALILGMSDRPDTQSQPVHALRIGADRGMSIVGGAGSGRSAAIRALAEQHPDAVTVPRELEAAWDTVSALARGDGAAPTLVFCDDLDALVAEYPPEYAQRLIALWEQALRSSPRTTFVLTASRVSGAVGRVLDLLPSRALLRMGSRVDHLAAGGDAASFDADRPPGRARIGASEVQIAWTAESMAAPGLAERPAGSVQAWEPRARVSALVVDGARRAATVLAEAYPLCTVRALADGADGVDRSSPEVLLVGEVEEWHRHGALWQSIRAEGEVLVHAGHIADLRQLAGVRELPPFAHAHAGRAWSSVSGAAPRRVIIPALIPR